MFLDKANRPHPITKGEPIAKALGHAPATAERCEPGGDPAFVPPYDDSLLLDTAFRPHLPLVPPAPPSRQKGWRASPIVTGNGFGVRNWAVGAFIGYGLEDEKAGAVVEAGARAVLAQEIRNARGGHYAFSATVIGVGSSRDEFDRNFLANMTCRLLLFRFRDTKKDPRDVEVLASSEFRPSKGKTETFKVDRFLGSTVPGANFAIGNGLGVAIIVEKKTAGPLTLPRNEPHSGGLWIHDVYLEFSPKARDENTVL
jgi:hypothetical protein